MRVFFPVFIALIFAPTMALAVLSSEQPPGQMPNVRPLLAQPENVKPNISGNIQTQQNSQTQTSEGDLQSPSQNPALDSKTGEIAEKSNQDSFLAKTKSTWFTWVWVGLILIFLSLASWFFWKKDV